ncbi:MAG: restriction endonuclease subunit S, partial [Bacteroidia bacterium]
MQDSTNGNELPKHWQTVISSEILDIRDGTHDTPKYVAENGFPLITSKNLKENKIDFEKVSLISLEDHLEISKRSKVEAGDILFAMIGTIGNPAIIKGDANFSIKNVGLFKKNEKVILPVFLVNFLRSSIFEKQLNERKLLKGTTQKFIPLGNLRKIEIPLPPLHEQKEIVSKIEQLLSELEKGKQQLEIAQQQLKVYRQSLLKWAFEGKLISK